MVYKINCKACDETYIGEIARALGIRLQEHKNVDTENKTAVAEHQVNEKHEIDWDNVRVLKREENTRKRKIKKALIIQQTKLEINKNPDMEIPLSMHVCCHVVAHVLVTTYKKLRTPVDEALERSPKHPVTPGIQYKIPC